MNNNKIILSTKAISHRRYLIYYFDLIRHLVRRDFSLRYKQSALGILWSLALPLTQLIVLVFLFKIIVPLNIDAYPAFVLSALLPWTWFSNCLNSSGSLFISNRDLIRHPNFIPVNLIVVNTLSNLLNYILAMPILFILLFFYNKSMTPALAALPLIILIQGTLIAGMSLIIATLNIFYRDIQHIVNVVIMLLFYMTPVFYRPGTVTEKYQLLYTLNPVAVLIQNYRAILFHGKPPEFNSMLLAGTTSVGMCCLGYFLYKHYIHDVIDTI
jgi:lipopolysaccharide transport system permease protein